MFRYHLIVGRTRMLSALFVLALAASTSGVGCAGAVDDRPAEWAYIQPVLLAPNCATASCHSRAAAVSGLDLSDLDGAYRGLFDYKVLIIGAEGAEPTLSPRPLVTPCHPGESRIVNMMRAQGAERMPPDRIMAEADIALIERWIMNGARRAPRDEDPCVMNASGGGSP